MVSRSNNRPRRHDILQERQPVGAFSASKLNQINRRLVAEEQRRHTLLSNLVLSPKKGDPWIYPLKNKLCNAQIQQQGAGVAISHKHTMSGACSYLEQNKRRVVSLLKNKDAVLTRTPLTQAVATTEIGGPFYLLIPFQNTSSTNRVPWYMTQASSDRERGCSIKGDKMQIGLLWENKDAIPCFLRL